MNAEECSGHGSFLRCNIDVHVSQIALLHGPIHHNSIPTSNSKIDNIQLYMPSPNHLFKLKKTHVYIT